MCAPSPCREGFIQALLLIFFSEIGDKTFFIALLLALQQPRGLVFAGTFGALAVMTVISVGLGRVLHLLDEVGQCYTCNALDQQCSLLCCEQALHLLGRESAGGAQLLHLIKQLIDVPCFSQCGQVLPR